MIPPHSISAPCTSLRYNFNRNQLRLIQLLLLIIDNIFDWPHYDDSFQAFTTQVLNNSDYRFTRYHRSRARKAPLKGEIGINSRLP